MSTEPQDRYAEQELPAQTQEHPGTEADLTPKADHGEDSYEGHGRLAGKRALITGGDSGIGRAVAIAFAREGADVAINYLPQEQEDADETVRLIEAAGRTALALPADVSEREACFKVVADTVEGLGGLDVLVSNAAFQMGREGLADLPSDELDHTFRTNVYAMVYLAQAALPHLQPGASIIATSSIQAYQPDPMLLAYAATKAAIVNLAKGMATELIEQGIRVNVVAPGPCGPRSSRRRCRPRRSSPSARARPRSAGPPSPPSCPRPTCTWPRTSRATCRGRSWGSRAARR
jgi:NAD(P)-dependent dehydrogenase (short-subunit alcohol dehydrogenase family)